MPMPTKTRAWAGLPARQARVAHNAVATVVRPVKHVEMDMTFCTLPRDCNRIMTDPGCASYRKYGLVSCRCVRRRTLVLSGLRGSRWNDGDHEALRRGDVTEERMGQRCLDPGRPRRGEASGGGEAD